ncbi:hypothetical protein ACFE04_006532 [Oxalis oulophora]
MQNRPVKGVCPSLARHNEFPLLELSRIGPSSCNSKFGTFSVKSENNDLKVEVLSFSIAHIDALVEGRLRITGFYGNLVVISMRFCDNRIKVEVGDVLSGRWINLERVLSDVSCKRYGEGEGEVLINVECEKVVKEVCNDSLDWINNLPKIQKGLMQWSRVGYGSVKFVIKKAYDNLNDVVCCRDKRENTTLMKNMEDEVNKLLDIEACMRRNNWIKGVYDNNGSWVSEEMKFERLRVTILETFSKLATCGRRIWIE